MRTQTPKDYRDATDFTTSTSSGSTKTYTSTSFNENDGEDDGEDDGEEGKKKPKDSDKVKIEKLRMKLAATAISGLLCFFLLYTSNGSTGIGWFIFSLMCIW